MSALPKITKENLKWWILVTMTGTFSMILIDSTVVSVALPTIQKDLDMGSTELQWIVNAYLLGLACLVAVGGRLADMFGQSRMFKIGIVIFIVASTFSGLAQSGAWIIASRAVQGVGAAMMIPPTMAIVINAFPVKERGTAMGIYAGISMVFLALGPMVGGLFTEYWSWRLVFWINVPIGIGVIVLSLLTVPKDRPTSKPVLDYPGLVTLVTGLVAFVLALMQSSVWGWGSPLTLGLLIGGALMIVLFVFIEPKMKNALVELRLFRSRNFSGNAAVLFLVQFILMGLTVFGSIWVQNVLGFSPVAAGASLLPMTLTLVIVAPRAGRIYDRIGPRALVALGAALIGAGFIWAAAVLGKQEFIWLIPAYLVQGIGIGLVMTPSSTDAMNSAPPKLRGQASGLLQTVRQVGGSVGLAIMGTIVTNIQTSKLTTHLETEEGLSAVEAQKLEGILSEAQAGQTEALGQIPPQLLQETIEAAKNAMTSGVSAAYYVAGAVMIVASVMAVIVLRRAEAVDADAPPVEPTM